MNDTVLSANNTNADAYQWIDCLDGNAPLLGETSVNFYPTSNGEYAVVITENGCADTSACEVIAVIGVDEFFGEGFEIYPNPTSGMLTLHYTAEQSHVKIQVFNVLGQLVDDKTIHTTDQISLNLDGENGFYTIRIVDAHGIHTHKIIKQD